MVVCEFMIRRVGCEGMLGEYTGKVKWKVIM